MDPVERARFDEFARVRLPALLRFGHVLTGDPDAAADLVQDALERAGMRWGRIETDDPVAYVRRIMVNRHIGIWRKLRRETVTDRPPDAGTVDRPSRDEDLWRLLATLPRKQRVVLVLRFYEDMTEAQIADVLGCSVGTVKSQKSRALAKLRTRLDMVEDADVTSTDPVGWR